VSLKEKVRSIRSLWIIFLIFLIVIGGIYFGWFTPTEAGAVGALSTFIVAVLKKKLDLNTIKGAIINAGVLSCAIGIIIIFGNLFSFYLTIDGFVENFPSFVISLEVPDVVVLISLLVMYLFLGCLIDPPSMIIVTMPIVYPIAEKLNYDPIWFGIIIVMMCEIAVKTPPLGMNLYSVKLAASDDLDMMSIIKGTLPFICIDIIVVIFLIIFPGLVTFLPSLIN
jgi:tripartite ATP-independent transporter DctM subunit